jgi:hypothetical protein
VDRVAENQKRLFLLMMQLYDRGEITLQDVFGGLENFQPFQQLLLCDQLDLLIYFLQQICGQSNVLDLDEKIIHWEKLGYELDPEKPEIYSDQLRQLDSLLCSQINSCNDKEAIAVLVTGAKSGLLRFLERMETESNDFVSDLGMSRDDRAKWSKCLMEGKAVSLQISITALERWLSL